MGWNKAFLFRDIRSFDSLVRRHVNAKTTKRPYRLYRVAAPGGSQQLVLQGFNPRSELQGEFLRVLLKAGPTEIQLKAEGGDPIGALVILETRESHQLAQLIALKPKEDNGEWAERWVVFHLKDPAWLSGLVSQSLALGNDRIQYAEYRTENGAEDGDGQGPAEGKGTGLFVRMETPSWYLLQQGL